MVSVKFSSVNLVAMTAAIGIGTAASASVVTISQTFFNSSNATRTYSFYQYAPLASGAVASVMRGAKCAAVRARRHPWFAGFATGNGRAPTSAMPRP